MKWCVRIPSRKESDMENEIEAAIVDAHDHGRELAAAVEWGDCLLLMFRRIPSSGGGGVRSVRLVDEHGYPR